MPLILVPPSIKKSEVYTLKPKLKKMLGVILLIGGMTFLFLLLFGTVAQCQWRNKNAVLWRFKNVVFRR